MADFSELIGELNDLIQYDKRLRTAATTVHNLMAQRVFGEGKAADGNEIGKYSTTPAYYYPAISPKKFQAVGIKGKSTFKDGKKHKMRYFKEGYAGLRQKAGRQINHVDLRLTGTLEASFVIDKISTGYGSGFTTDLQDEIASGNEERFSKIVFELTEQEEDTFVELMATL